MSRLRASVVLPEDSAWNRVELKLLVDDQDMIGPVFDQGPWQDPDALLGPDSPLLPGEEPREVMLAEAAMPAGTIVLYGAMNGPAVMPFTWPLTVHGHAHGHLTATAGVRRKPGRSHPEWHPGCDLAEGRCRC